MKNTILLLTFLSLLVLLTQQQTPAYACPQFGGRCEGKHTDKDGRQIDNCLNNICSHCDTAANGISSLCEHAKGFFYPDMTTKVKTKCSDNCLECSGSAENCTACVEGEGIALEYASEADGNNKCACLEGFNAKHAGDTVAPICEKCFWYGNKCEASCPAGTKPDETYMQCEKETTEDITNDDDTIYIIVTVFLIILIIVLTVFLYNYFYGIFKKIFEADRHKVLPLTEEEKFYLANQQELERQRRIKEEELARQLAQEEEERRIEEEKRRVEKEQEEKRIKEEEEERRREQEEAERRRIEEEECRRRAEEEAIRQMEEEAEKRRIEEEIRLQAIAEEEERKRVEEEKRLEEEKKEEERKQVLELARQAREERKNQRQMVKQATMAQNDAKVQALREERQKIEDEKKAMEEFNKKMMDEANEIDNEVEEAQKRIEEAKRRAEETERIKQSIIQRQANIDAQKKELDQALEGVDVGSALAKVKGIQQDDIVFLQSLKTPSERIRLCLEAVVMTLTNSTKKIGWDDIKKEISNINFRRNMLSYDPESLGDKLFSKIKKEYTNNPQWNLAKITKASQAAGFFAEWLDAIVKYKTIKMENKPLFDKLKALKEEQAKMDEENEKLDQLAEEEKSFQEEQEKLKMKQSALRDKQQTLRKQATMKMEEIKKKEEEANKLKTGELDLDQIEESEEESDLDSDLDIDTLNQKMAQ